MTKPMCERYEDVLLHVDTSRPVEVYRNLHKNCLSVRQDRIVKCHAENGVCLYDADFVVRQGGREKVLREKRKNVHAFVKGYVRSPRDADALIAGLPWDGIYYNPYKYDSFMCGKNRVRCAQWVDISAHPSDVVPQILAFNIRYKDGELSAVA